MRTALPAEHAAPGASPASLLIDKRGAAVMLGMSPRTLVRMSAAGITPPSVRIGGKLLRWRVAELSAFAAGTWAAQGARRG